MFDLQDKKPLIGITPGYDYDKNLTYIKKGYMEGIHEAGGLAVLLPPCAGEGELEEFIQRLDGILLSGGTDIDAVFFGEENLSCNGNISPYRDKTEIFLAKRAFELKKPLLGICRGIQVLNVALGGSIYQDIQLQLKNKTFLKHSQDAPRWYGTHDIDMIEGSYVFSSFGRPRARVNSFHHQAVKELAPGFNVTAVASDGVIEAIEYGGGLFAVGVQWHPELMWQEDRIYLKIFESFVKAAQGS